MKTLVFIIALLFNVTAQLSLLAQNNINSNNYLFKISLRDSKFYSKGYLMNTTDSTITISTRNSILPKDQRIFQVEDIEYIDLKNQLHKKAGIVAGVCVGITAAAIMGYKARQHQDDFFTFSPEGTFFISSLLTVPAGAILGALIPGNKRPILIKNNRKNYAQQRAQIEKYKYKN